MEIGSRRLILPGNCGVLDKSIEGCGIIVPIMAIRDEGTSYHYAKPGDTIPVKKIQCRILRVRLSVRIYVARLFVSRRLNAYHNKIDRCRRQ